MSLVKGAWIEYDRFMETPQAGWNVVGNLPILYFGNWEAYADSSLRIITVGYNPSRSEFPKAGKSRFPGDLRRGDSIRKYTQAMNGYFDENPYEDWFRHYEKLLRGLEATYGGKMRSAIGGVDVASNSDRLIRPQAKALEKNHTL